MIKQITFSRWLPGTAAVALFASALALPASAAPFRADTSADETRCRVVFSWSETRQTGPAAEELPAAATHAGLAVQVSFDQSIDIDAVDTLPARLPGCVDRVQSGERFVELKAPEATEFRVAKTQDVIVVDIVKPQPAAAPAIEGETPAERMENALDAGRLDTVQEILDHENAAWQSERPLLAATAYTALKRRKAALEWMARAEKNDGLAVDEMLHLASLYLKLGREGAPTADFGPLASRLAGSLEGAPAEDQREIAHALIDLGADALALPGLLKLAESEGGDWVFAYTEAAARLGKHDEVARFWAARARLPDLSKKEKRDIAFLVLETDKQAALGIFRELADSEPPGGENVGQLLYLWGDKPGDEATGWLAARARAAKGDDRAGWLSHLMNLGASALVIAVVGEVPPRHAEILHVYLEALALTGDGPAAAAAIRENLAAENRVSRLQYFAGVAEGLNEYGAASDVHRKLLTLEPNEPRHQKALGYAEMNLKHWPAAAESLKNYLDKEDGGWLVHYQYAEVNYILDNASTAKTHYALALDKMKTEAGESFKLRAARAKALSRLGHEKEAESAYEGLLVERPRDTEVRISYIAALMEQGNYRRARELLARP